MTVHVLEHETPATWLRARGAENRPMVTDTRSDIESSCILESHFKKPRSEVFAP